MYSPTRYQKENRKYQWTAERIATVLFCAKCVENTQALLLPLEKIETNLFKSEVELLCWLKKCLCHFLLYSHPKEWGVKTPRKRRTGKGPGPVPIRVPEAGGRHRTGVHCGRYFSEAGTVGLLRNCSATEGSRSHLLSEARAPFPLSPTQPGLVSTPAGTWLYRFPRACLWLVQKPLA